MSTISPPATTTGTGDGKAQKARVKMESTGAEGEKDKPFKCDLCVKRYARRDYLERHLLNHDARNYACQACGKGFARMDVLKKHELNACKVKHEMRNEVESLRSNSRSRTDKEETIRRSRDFPIPVSAPRPIRPVPQSLPQSRSDVRSFEIDHRAPSATRGEGRKRQLSRSSSEGEENVLSPDPRYRPQYPQYPGEYTPSHRYQQSLTLQTATSTYPMPLISPSQSAHRGGDMSLSLAPAYAPTPTPISPSPVPTHPHENSESEMPGKVGDNMDDLLSWLFNSNTGGDWSGQDMGGQQYVPNFFEPISNRHELVNTTDQNPAYYHYDPPTSTSSAQVQAGIPTSNGQGPIPNAESGPSGQHKRYPQPVHPLYVPNIPGKTSIPTFTGGGGRERKRYREIIDEDVKADMMDMFERAGKEALSSPAFSIHRMRLYLELYFMHFAPLYPIIHQPSLLYRRLPPDLLLALICIGTAFAEDKEGLRIASFLHKRLRNRIFEMVEDEPKASVHNLQTLLLINHFSRSYCSLKEHAISQIFHSPSVYMIRLAGTLLPRFNRQNPPSDDPLTCWLDWVGEEERKRLGWFAFMMDLENAALYRHFLMIHCYFMEIPFPTSSASWIAKDPYDWSTHLRSSLSIPTPSFRSALRELAGRGNIPHNLNDQSLWILIHGLINVSWTLLWRDLGELSMVHENKITGWKDSLRRAFGVWVKYVEARSSAGGMEEALYTVGIPFAQLGSILLLSDTEMIRIFAGAANIAGRSISPGEWTAANTYVHAWAKSQDGAYACYTAIELLHQIYKWSAEDRWATAPAFIPWCTYVSSLIIWAYSTVLDGPDSLQAPYIIPTAKTQTLEHGQSPEMIIEPSLARRAAQIYLGDMLAQCRGEVFALPDVRGKNACAGVLAYTAHLVGIGGRGVLEEARRVLLGLLSES